jgi:hypothetical protein
VEFRTAPHLPTEGEPGASSGLLGDLRATGHHELFCGRAVKNFEPKLSFDWPADLLHNPQRFQSKVSGFCAAADRGAGLSATTRGQPWNQVHQPVRENFP